MAQVVFDPDNAPNAVTSAVQTGCQSFSIQTTTTSGSIGDGEYRGHAMKMSKAFNNLTNNDIPITRRRDSMHDKALNQHVNSTINNKLSDMNPLTSKNNPTAPNIVSRPKRKTAQTNKIQNASTDSPKHMLDEVDTTGGGCDGGVCDSGMGAGQPADQRPPSS